MLERYERNAETIADAIRLRDLAAFLEDEGREELAAEARSRWRDTSFPRRAAARLAAPVYNPGWRRPAWRDRMAPFGARMAEYRLYREGFDDDGGG